MQEAYSSVLIIQKPLNSFISSGDDLQSFYSPKPLGIVVAIGVPKFSKRTVTWKQKCLSLVSRSSIKIHGNSKTSN